MDETTKIIEKHFESAPKEIQNLILKDRWSQTVSNTSIKYNLSSEQTSRLKDEVLFVLLGLEFRGDLRVNIKNNLNIPEMTANSLSQSINERIFREVDTFLPTGSEEDMLPQAGAGLIEDREGNKDNVIRDFAFAEKNEEGSVVQVKTAREESPPQQNRTSKPPLNLPTNPSVLEKKIEDKIQDDKGKLKNSAGGEETPEDTVMHKQYPGQDPYRESVE